MLSEGTRGTPASHTPTPTFTYDLADELSPVHQPILPPGYFDLRQPQFPITPRRSSLRLAKRQDDATSAREPPSALEVDPKPRPFSFMKLRHASDPQLFTRFREDAPASTIPAYEAAPAPTIGYTSSPPAKEVPREKKTKRKFLQQFSLRSRTSSALLPTVNTNEKRLSGASSLDVRNQTTAPSSPKLPEATIHQNLGVQPQPSSLSLRPPESSTAERRESADASNQRPSLAGRSGSSRSRLFRLPNRKDKSEPLFPLPMRVQPPQSSPLNPSSQLRNSAASSPTKSFSRSPFVLESSTTQQRNESPRKNSMSGNQITLSRLGSQAPSFNAPFLGPSLMRLESSVSANSEPSLSGVLPPSALGFRGRSSTINSVSVRGDDEWSSIPGYQASGRTSEASTTLGRNSIAGLRSLTSRLRHSSEPQSPQRPSPGGAMGSSGVNSHNNSFALSRETLAVPEREEGETSGKYYARLEHDISKRSIAMLMSKSSDPFSGDVLRSLMRTFKFYEEPMDIAMRRFLWEIDLPGEAQQIDRVMSAFAERYHECNPHIFDKPDQAYLAAYSLIILHSDLYNKNNKHKMQKAEYQKNTGGHGIADEILGYFYDNIQYTEFIAQSNDDDVANGYVKGGVARSKKPRPKDGGETTRSGKLDPYDFIVDSKLKLETLRPPLKEILNLDDTFNYVGLPDTLDVHKLHWAFTRCGLLQLVSARSRPEAFTSLNTITNPNEASPGLVNIQVVKAGLIWRKDTKKKKTRSPWQEWGAILTPSQLYFFKNVGWVKGLMQQFDTHHRLQGHRGSYLFKPPLSEFKPDLGISANNAVALLDSNYKKHKNAFVYYQSSGGDYFEEVLLADNEHELVDWLAKLNYAATLTTTKLTLRPLPMADRTDFKGLLEGTNGSSLDISVAKETLQSFAGQEESLNSLSFREAKAMRRNVIQVKIAYIEDNIPKAVTEVEDHLKVARHLQILAPFPEKTRRDLLVSGARVAHRLRTARYTVWRWRCQRDILYKELDAETHAREDHLVVTKSIPSRPTTPMSAALSRLNSKTSILTTGHKISKPLNHVSRLSTHSIAMSHQGTDAGVTSPEVHLSPRESQRRNDSRSDSSFKVPALNATAGPADANLHDRKVSESTEMSHHPSVGSQISTTDAAIETDEALPVLNSVPSANGPISPIELLRRSSTNVESEKEYVTPLGTPLGSPDSRIKIRKSLHRTLRDSRDTPGSQSSRSKRIKEGGAIKDNIGEAMVAGGLPRGTGSFTVHGKKASVITLGSEWQSMSAEELLRSRKQALSDDSRATLLNSPLLLGDGELMLSDIGSKDYRHPPSRRTSDDFLSGEETTPAVNLTNRDKRARRSASSADFDSDAFYDVEEYYNQPDYRD